MNFWTPVTVRRCSGTAGRRFRLGLVLAIATATVCFAQRPAPANLGDTSLEDLLKLQVTSASKKPQTLSKAGSAIFVVSQEDIRSSGAANIPDLLRMVPGVQVAEINANVWAISIRGLNDRYADGVLVLIDGRSVYSPTTSGVNWDQQNVPLEDIDRIEVIRGSGGTVWGANAMNGVINIITKSTRLTKGGLITAAAGSGSNGEGLAQYGADIGRHGTYRAFGSFSSIGDFPSPRGVSIRDGWNKAQAGFRSDWDLSSRDTLTVQGEFFRDRGGQTIETLVANTSPTVQLIQDTFGVTSGNVLARWDRALSNGSSFTVQSYYDQSSFRSLGVRDSRKTFDLDLDYHLKAGTRHDIVWGLGYRASADSTTPGYAARFDPPRRADQLFSAFFQDEFKLSNSMWLTVGSKVERNSYTGFEYEPSARLVWEASERQSLWFAVSRAIRQPATYDTGIVYDSAIILPTGAPGVVQVRGSSSRGTERLRSLEAGYRTQWNRNVSLEVTSFANFYSGMETTTAGQPFLSGDAFPHVVVPLTLTSGAHGFSYGGEIAANWTVNSRWRLSAGTSLVHLTETLNAGSGPEVVTVPGPETNTPRNQFQGRSSFLLTKNLSWDATLSRPGRLAVSGTSSVPGYARFDTQLRWRITKALEFDAGGRNLLQRRHAEFFDQDSLLHSLVARTVFGKLTWRF